jgi:hypothetical protein
MLVSSTQTLGSQPYSVQNITNSAPTEIVAPSANTKGVIVSGVHVWCTAELKLLSGPTLPGGTFNVPGSPMLYYLGPGEYGTWLGNMLLRPGNGLWIWPNSTSSRINIVWEPVT